MESGGSEDEHVGEQVDPEPAEESYPGWEVEPAQSGGRSSPAKPKVGKLLSVLRSMAGKVWLTNSMQVFPLGRGGGGQGTIFS